MKKKVIIISVIFVLIISGITFIHFAFYKPTKLNFFIASKLYKTPANTAFTDDNFYKCVVDNYNKQNNASVAYTDSLTDEQLETLKYLDCSAYSKQDDEKIVNTSGLEKIKNIGTLDLNNNKISSINLIQNTKLKILRVESNLLENLNVDNNINLEIIEAYNNKLIKINLINNELLTWLDVSNNQIEALDISKNIELSYLNARSNKLNALDISENLSLSTLYIESNNLRTLDVSNNNALTNLMVGFNKLESLNLKNSNLKQLLADNNKLLNVDLTNSPNLEYIDLGGNKLTEINVTNAKNLKTLCLEGASNGEENNLTNIDLSQNINLEALRIYNNKISNIDLSNNINLKQLDIHGNNISEIDLSNNVNLSSLYISNNNLNSIDLSANKSLITLDLSENNLTELDITNNTSLINLNVDSNKLTTLDTTNNTKLKTLDLYDNELKTIDTSKNPELTRLILYSNNLSGIDLSNNINLIYLLLTDNNLANIKLYDGFDISTASSVIGSQNISQTKIDFGNNKIIEPANNYNFYINSKLVIEKSVSVSELKENLGINNLDIKVYNGEAEITSENIETGYILKIYDGETLIQSLPIHIHNNEVFADENFYKCIVDAYNKENKTNILYTEILTEEQLKSITELVCRGDSKSDSEKIINTSGLEKLTSLTKLTLNDNKITAINLSNNKSLIYLNLIRNQLTELNISNNTQIEDLYATYNPIETIDLSNNINLVSLNLGSENQKKVLKQLNLSKNINLKKLYLYGTGVISELNLTNNLKLEQLSIQGSDNITTLNLTNNTKLESVIFQLTNLIELDLSNLPIEYAHIAFNEKLKNINLSNTNLSSLSLNNWEGESVLTNLNVSNSKLTTLNLKSETALQELDIQNNQIQTIDVSANTALKSASLSNNPYKTEVAIYKGESVDLNKDKGLVKLFEGKSSTLNSLTTNSEKVTIKDGIVTSNTIGLYTLNAEYSHDVSTYNNTYTGTYFMYVIEATSVKYEINENEEYIYTGLDTDEETILSNISLNYGQASIEDNKLLIKYNDETIKMFNIVNISSEQYDLTKDYIYTGTKNLALENINVLNGTNVIKDNKLLIKYNDEILQEYLLVSNSSKTYKFLDNNIYVGSEEQDIEKIEVINGTGVIKDGKLKIKYNDEILNEYLILNIHFGELKSNGKYIVVTENISYEDFTNNITTSEKLTYKIFNEENEMTEGNVSKGMTLKVYYNDEVIDTYEITDEYLDLSLLNVDEDKDLIKNLVLGTTVSEFNEKISTSGNITVVDKNNTILTDDRLITSGSKIKIELTSDTYEYTLSVKGDITGTGSISVSDVAKLYQYYKKRIDIEEYYIEAGNVVSTDNEIKLNDVAKLYQYYKGRINSLE